MNPLVPPLAISAAYVALWLGREPAARLLAALREPGQDLAMTRLWRDLLAEHKANPSDDLARFAQAVFVLSDNLNVTAHSAPRIVAIVVKTLRPPPGLLPGYLWSRPGMGTPWAPRPAFAIPDTYHTEAALPLAAIYTDGARLAVVGADDTFATYEEAATVSEWISFAAPRGLDSGLRAARHYVKRELPGADAALSLAERLAAAVEGL